MKLFRRLNLAIGALALIWLSGVVLVARVTAQGQPTMTLVPGQNSGQAFKNVTTSTLKVLSPDDFIGAMGVISAALGFDCADCHPGAGSDDVNWVIDTPLKVTARRMVEMVASINKTNFGGVQRVTCWTCHHGRVRPATSIQLDTLYDTPNTEVDDIVTAEPGQPTPDQVIDKYIQAIGGRQRLAGLNSFIATGTSLGYFGLGGTAEFTIYAKSPSQRATTISYKDHPERGTSAWVFDGKAGWTKTPRSLLGAYQTTGGELEGFKLEAQLAFPIEIKSALTNWRVGGRRSIGSQDYVVLQGTGVGGFMATLYFHPETGLLTRVVRYGPSPVGRVVTQIDYADYRDVSGIKFPFEQTFLWLDGRYTAKLSGVKTNVPIEASRFAKPAGQ